MAESRTKYVFKNLSVGIGCEILNSVLGFILRYFFILHLGIEYLGVNGLFSNILQFLSLIELGVGSAIVYRLYAPLKNKDIELLKSLMQLYRIAYTWIGMVVLFLGLLLTPFIPYLIKGNSQIQESLYLIYALFVINSGISYFFVYKQSLIIADQKNYIVSLIRQGMKLLQSIAQIVILIVFKDFIAYLILGIIFTLAINIIISIKANQLYPFLRDKNIQSYGQEQRKGLFSDVKSVMIFKTGYIILNNANNIVLSLFLGITYVGLGSNYFLITAALEIVVVQIFNAFTASVGNYNVSQTTDEKWKLFRQLNFILTLLCGLLYGGALLFSDSFINLWIGDEYALQTLSAASIMLYMFLKNSGSVGYMFRTTQGAFKQVRYLPITISIIHTGLAILLVNWIGFAGVFISASLAMIFLNFYDGLTVARVSGFKFRNVAIMWLKLTFYVLVSITIAWYVSSLIIALSNDWFLFVSKVFCFIFLYIISVVLISYKTSNSCKELIGRLKGISKLMSRN